MSARNYFAMTLRLLHDGETMKTVADRHALWQQLIRHEGIRLKVYTDSVGVPTIGVGRNLKDKGITHAEAMVLLEHDIDECVRDCATFPWFEDLDAVRQRVIVEMRFQLGPTKLRRFTNTLAAVARGDYPATARGMLNSKWARQTPTRVKRLAEMMRSGDEPTT